MGSLRASGDPVLRLFASFLKRAGAAGRNATVVPSAFFWPGFRLLTFRTLLVAVLALPAAVHAASRVQAAPVPAEMRSTAFTVTVNGQPVDVAHAAASYEFVSFDVTGPVDVADHRRRAGLLGSRRRYSALAAGTAANPAGPDHPLPARRARPSSPSPGPATS